MALGNDTDAMLFRGVDVLLADSNRTVCRSLHAPLNELGFRVLDDANDVDQLYRAFEAHDPGLLMCDIQLPGGSPFRLVRDVRRGRIGNQPSMIMIATTEARDEETIRHALRVGFDDVVLKPLTTQHVIERIRHLARHRRPFIVAPGYIGPDRRHDENRADKSSPYVVDAPNPLAGAEPAEHRRQTDALWQAIEQVRRARWQERKVPIALHVLEVMELVIGDFAQYYRTQQNSEVINGLRTKVSALQTALGAKSDRDLQPLLSAVEASIAEVSDMTPHDGEGEARLLADLAGALHTVFQERDS